MDKKSRLKTLLEGLLALYSELLAVTQKERDALVEMDVEELAKITDLKQYAALKIKQLSDELKVYLASCNVENVSQWLLICSEGDVDDIRVLNGKLESAIERFNSESEINRMIVQESVSFYNSMLNMYASFVGGNENYNRDATVEVNQHALSVRV